MPSQPITSSAATTTSVDAQRVENALQQLAPKWTTAFVHTIARYGPEMRIRDLSRYVPSISQQNIGKRLGTMTVAGLVVRDAEFDRTAPYRLTSRALTLGPVYRALAQWSSDHVDRGTQGRSDRIEDALRRLQPVNTTAVVQLLAENGSMRFTHLAEAVGVSEQQMGQRLARLQSDGLVTRTGARHGDPYILTGAGRALGPVYAAVQRWEDRHAPVPTAPVPTAVRTLSGLVDGADGARTAAALRRTAVPAALFSHTSQPQLRVPAATSSSPGPTRGR